MNNLQLHIKQMLGEIDVEKLILHNANEKKRLMVKVKAPIIYKCYAHIIRIITPDSYNNNTFFK